jgi:C4-dicarboxylate-specific signal transduction histidine kinase
VLLNCLFNAADAMAELPPDQREIRVTTNNASHYIYGESLVLHVADCGPGVPDESLGEIFEPFYTTKEVGKGTGLGLFVCQTIVDGLGGTMSAANRDGGGLEIRVELPLPAEEETASR